MAVSRTGWPWRWRSPVGNAAANRGTIAGTIWGPSTSQTDEFGSNLYRRGDRVIVEQVARIASERQVPERR